MSKSAADPNSRILLTDTYPEIRAKVRAAVTDSVRGVSYDPIERPGTSNLLTIIAGCSGEDVQDVALRYRDSGHGQLKADVVEVVEECFKGPRAEFERLRQDKGFLESVEREGAARAKEVSNGTLTTVRKLVGLSS